MYIDSQCPQCHQINHIDTKGKHVILVHCQHCIHGHEYEHLVTQYSRTEFDVEQELRHKVEDMIVEKRFAQMSDKTIVCLLVFNNGLEQEGKATVKNADDFRLTVGRDKAYEDALKRSIIVLGGVLGKSVKI